MLPSTVKGIFNTVGQGFQTLVSVIKKQNNAASTFSLICVNNYPEVIFFPAP